MERAWKFPLPIRFGGIMAIAGVGGIAGTTLAAAIAVAVHPASAQEPTDTPVAEDALPDGGRTAGPSTQGDGLDKLLKLPNSYSYSSPSTQPRRKGATQTEWHNRFSEARLELRTAEEKLSEAQQAMEQTAGESGQWSMGAPGSNVSTENSPVSFKLRQEIRRQREAVDRAERKLRQLDVEADLADVPEAWRE